MDLDENAVHTIGVGRRRRRLRQMVRTSPGRARPAVAAMARSETSAVVLGRDRTAAGRSLTKGTGARSDATSTQIARNVDLSKKYSPESRRPPDCLVLSRSVRQSPIVGMASAEKGQQARSEIAYPGHVGRHGGRPSNSVTVNPTWRDHEGVHDWIINPPSSRFIPLRRYGGRHCRPSRPNRCGSSLTPSYQIMNPGLVFCDL
jgi:hypothetical protein